MKSKSGNIHRLKRGALVLVLAGALGGLWGGCLAVAVGAGAAGAVAYVRGELATDLEHDMDAVFRAANQAVLDLEFAKISESKDALQAFLVARNAADRRIDIRLERKSPSLTHVAIRVGLFGDESLSLTILDRIKENL